MTPELKPLDEFVRANSIFLSEPPDANEYTAHLMKAADQLIKRYVSGLFMELSQKALEPEGRAFVVRGADTDDARQCGKTHIV